MCKSLSCNYKKEAEIAACYKHLCPNDMRQMSLFEIIIFIEAERNNYARNFFIAARNCQKARSKNYYLNEKF